MAEEAEDVLDGDVLDAEGLAPETGAESQTPAFDPEAVARLAGWSPLDQWRGDPADWKDATAFLVDTAAVNKTLRKDVKELRQTVERTARTADRIIRSERERSLEEARAELRNAVQAGDEDAADAAAAKIAGAAASPAKSPVDEFAERHAWFGIHAAATGLAQTEAEKVFRQGGDEQAQFAAAERIVRTKFPELFEDEAEAPPERQQRQAPPVQAGQRAPAAAPKKGFNALPAEARKAAENFVKTTKGRMTLEDYAKIYFEENA